MVSAIADGTVTARATANDGSGVFGTLDHYNYQPGHPRDRNYSYRRRGSHQHDHKRWYTAVKCQITPADASDKTVTWSVQNETGKAEISQEGLLTAISAGEIVAKATSTDGSNISGVLNIAIMSQLPTGTADDKPEETFIKISPSAINIEMNKNTPYEQISIYNIAGSPVLVQNIKTLNESVDVTQFLPGIYILVISGKGEILTRKLVLH